jgi:putative intracellular protease/amidase
MEGRRAGRWNTELVSTEVGKIQAFDHLTPAVAFAKSFLNAGRPVAVICHGPWTLIEADVVRGRTITSWPSVRTDLRNAGANWVDDEVVECARGPNMLVSGRKPDDLPAFCDTLVAAFATDKSSPNSATRMLRRL